MRPQLKDYTYPAIEEFIHEKVEECGGNGVVVGLSGGVDSATVSKLCMDAVGNEKVLNIFIPAETSNPADRKDAEAFCKKFKMELKVVDICAAVNGFKDMLPSMDKREFCGNVMARCRMIVIYHHARLSNRIVMGTSNKSELLTGYFTKFGDGGADFCPIGDLYKTQVRQLAKEIGVPDAIIEKAPTAGLWSGQTDEDELGISYDELDQVLLGLENSLSNEDISKDTGISLPKVERVLNMYTCSIHKRKMPLIPKLSLRTIGSDWRE